MKINYLAFAVPFFLFFIGIEYFISKKLGKNYFKFNSSVANLNIGIIERIADILVAGSFVFYYVYLENNWGIFDIKPTWWLWILLLIATDFLWYWYHRFGHEINLFWGFHVVHHTSEEFNYTAGTRITIFQSVVRSFFWSVLPIIGFPAEMITSIIIIHGAYPFFTHTQTIGKLGWLEYILVTPSHHRVDHANNEEYLDKNFGDIFIFWDKLFGTFTEEKQAPTFGLTKQLNSYSVIWQHFHFLAELFFAIKNTNGVLEKIKLLFGSPSTFDPSIRQILEKKLLSKNKIITHSTRFKKYIAIQLAAILLILFLLLLFHHHLTFNTIIYTSLFLIICVINCGAILEQKRWIFYLEITRILILIPILYEYFPIQTLNLVIGFIIYNFLFDLDDYKKFHFQYLRLVYGKI